MNDDPVPSLFVFLLGYGGFAVVSLLLLLAIHRMRRPRRHYVNAQRHMPADVVEDDGEYHD